MSNFKDYNDIIVLAFDKHPKQQEVIDRKKEIVDRVSEHYNLGSGSILFVGFNPAMIGLSHYKISVTEISNEGLSCLEHNKVKFDHVESPIKKYDLVVTTDEYFTFIDSEEKQRQKIQQYCNLAGSCLITTLRDYKNLDFKVREYSEPAVIRSGDSFNVFSEIHNWDQEDRYSFETFNYTMTDSNAKFLGKFYRRTLFFKQLAKISSDAGSTNFVVHKNLMFKSLIKKNYEHVISIDFN